MRLPELRGRLILGDERPEEEPLRLMRERARPGDTWLAYQNHDLGHPDLGRLTFFVVGPGRTYQDPPRHAPDSAAIGLGWRYLLVGYVDLDSGRILPFPVPSEPAPG